MSTWFTLTIAHPEPDYAGKAAREVFLELDELERKLSRFMEGSDVFRINRLKAGETTAVSVETYECLHIALAVQKETDGAFDMAFRSAFGGNVGARLELLAGEPVVRALCEGLSVDLGGIGKGYALDRLALVLADWEIESALLCASSSTMLAMSAPPGALGWDVSIGPDNDVRRMTLANRAVSASGKSVKGEHIMNPATGCPCAGVARAWSVAKSAAEADALSTAYMVMDVGAVERLCERHKDVEAYLLREDGGRLIAFKAA